MFNQIIEILPDQLDQQYNQSGISGPLSDLDNNTSNMQYNLYKYPISSVESNQPDKGHEIIFYINIPTTSYWGDSSDNVIPNNYSPIANRLSDPTRFALRQPSDSDIGTIGGAIQYSGTALANQIIKRKSKRTTAAISLYIPNIITFDQNMAYETISLTTSLGVGADIAAAISGVTNGDGRVVGGALASMAPDVAKFFGAHVPGINTLDNNVLSALGLADNPMNYLMFKQINFRKFHFDFLLVPENEHDAQIINQIIYLFRFHSAPEIASGSLGRFFVPPSDFDIDILHNGSRNTKLPRISTCVCNDVSVQYGANGHWSTMTDGQPAVIRLSLSMTEVEIMTRDRIIQGF